MRRIKTVARVDSLGRRALHHGQLHPDPAEQLRARSPRRWQAGNYQRSTANDDPRFVDYFGTVDSVVTSGAVTDSGMFETNLRDERFLPFEGAGAISTWTLSLPADPQLRLLHHHRRHPACPLHRPRRRGGTGQPRHSQYLKDTAAPASGAAGRPRPVARPAAQPASRLPHRVVRLHHRRQTAGLQRHPDAWTTSPTWCRTQLLLSTR